MEPGRIPSTDVYRRLRGDSPGEAAYFHAVTGLARHSMKIAALASRIERSEIGEAQVEKEETCMSMDKGFFKAFYASGLKFSWIMAKHVEFFSVLTV